MENDKILEALVPGLRRRPLLAFLAFLAYLSALVARGARDRGRDAGVPRLPSTDPGGVDSTEATAPSCAPTPALLGSVADRADPLP